MSEQDTREEIEMDIDCYRDEENTGCLQVPIYRVRSWLNRQAALTERETKLRELYKFGENHRANIEAVEEVNRKLNERIAELTTEVDSLREALDACGTGTMYELWRKDHAQLEALRAALHDKPGT